MFSFNFSPPESSKKLPELRQQVRQFLQTSLADTSNLERAHSWMGFDADFSQKLGQQGWIGMQWPQDYGGSGRTASERYVVIEELLAAGAPVAAHWFADRQSGALLLRYATEEIKQQYLPKMARGELYCCIGMSEPNAGSDLASIKTKAIKTEQGWVINGAKLWTTNVDKSQLMIALVRTGDSESNTQSNPQKTSHKKHGGLSQILIDLSLPGITVNPITDQTGESHFGEVFFDDVLVPENCLIGVVGSGWQQVNEELSLERSGPERYLSSYRLLEDYIAALNPDPPDEVVNLIGHLISELWTLRQMSLTVANQISSGNKADIEAAMVKDLGATFEQELPQQIQAMVGGEVYDNKQTALNEVLNYLLAAAPSFSLRGGTREILRGIIARGLGLR